MTIQPSIGEDPARLPPIEQEEAKDKRMMAVLEMWKI